MNESGVPNTAELPFDAAARKRVILSIGGKGGVGKTSIMTGLAELFDANEIPVKLLDLDTENRRFRVFSG